MCGPRHVLLPGLEVLCERCAVEGRTLCSFPGDGQYQSLLEGHGGLRVAEHLCEKLDLNYAWMWSRWDQAHEMELALNTVRSEVAYFKALASFVAARNEKYLFGKHHGRVRQWAERWHTKLESMAAICTSRFHGSDRRCYKNLFQNLTIFIADQKAELAALGVTTPPQDLLVAKSLETSVQLAGTIDLLGLTKDLSVHMQTVNTLFGGRPSCARHARALVRAARRQGGTA